MNSHTEVCSFVVASCLMQSIGSVQIEEDIPWTYFHVVPEIQNAICSVRTNRLRVTEENNDILFPHVISTNGTTVDLIGKDLKYQELRPNLDLLKAFTNDATCKIAQGLRTKTGTCKIVTKGSATFHKKINIGGKEYSMYKLAFGRTSYQFVVFKMNKFGLSVVSFKDQWQFGIVSNEDELNPEYKKQFESLWNFVAQAAKQHENQSEAKVNAEPEVNAETKVNADPEPNPEEDCQVVIRSAEEGSTEESCVVSYFQEARVSQEELKILTQLQFDTNLPNTEFEEVVQSGMRSYMTHLAQCEGNFIAELTSRKIGENSHPVYEVKIGDTCFDVIVLLHNALAVSIRTSTSPNLAFGIINNDENLTGAILEQNIKLWQAINNCDNTNNNDHSTNKRKSEREPDISAKKTCLQISVPNDEIDLSRASFPFLLSGVFAALMLVSQTSCLLRPPKVSQKSCLRPSKTGNRKKTLRRQPRTTRGNKMYLKSHHYPSYQAPHHGHTSLPTHYGLTR